MFITPEIWKKALSLLLCEKKTNAMGKPVGSELEEKMRGNGPLRHKK